MSAADKAARPRVAWCGWLHHDRDGCTFSGRLRVVLDPHDPEGKLGTMAVELEVEDATGRLGWVVIERSSSGFLYGLAVEKAIRTLSAEANFPFDFPDPFPF